MEQQPAEVPQAPAPVSGQASEAVSTEAQPAPAAEAPAPDAKALGADKERLEAELKSAQEEVHQHRRSMGRMSDELGKLRQQTQAAPTPSQVIPEASPLDNIDEILLENPALGAQMIRDDAIQAARDAAREAAREESLAVAGQVERQRAEREEFYAANPDLKGNEWVVQGVVEEMRTAGEFERMDQITAQETVVQRARERITGVRGDPGDVPTPPPVSPATAPPTTPGAPEPEPTHDEAQQRAVEMDRRAQMERLRNARSGGDPYAKPPGAGDFKV